MQNMIWTLSESNLSLLSHSIVHLPYRNKEHISFVSIKEWNFEVFLFECHCYPKHQWRTKHLFVVLGRLL
jgi:hypothetical protein